MPFADGWFSCDWAGEPCGEVSALFGGTSSPTGLTFPAAAKPQSKSAAVSS